MKYVICKKMDGIRGHHVEINQVQKAKYHVFIHLQKLDLNDDKNNNRT
jgi:hypothetical protein